MALLTLFEDFQSEAERGGQRVIWVAGDLDRWTAVRLRQCLDQWIMNDDVQQIVLDLGAVTFIDLSGLDVLACASRLLGLDGRRLTLRNPAALSPVLVQVLELAGIANVDAP